MKKFKIIGYIIFFLSCFLWALILIIPWLGFSKGQIAGIITILVIAGEITFYLSIFILGKSFIDSIKSKFKIFNRKKNLN